MRRIWPIRARSPPGLTGWLGTALAFVMVGAGLGAMILPVAAQSVITRTGWRAAYASLGGLALLLGLPLSWRYIRERGSRERKTFSVTHAGMSWQQGLRSFPFWIVTAILFVSSISMNGAITHLSPLLTDRGLTTSNAALCASILGGSSLLGRIFVGWLLDRFFGPHVAFAINAITALGIFAFSSRRWFLDRHSGGRSHWHWGRRRSGDYTLSAHAVFPPCARFRRSTVSPGLSMPLLAQLVR